MAFVPAWPPRPDVVYSPVAAPRGASASARNAVAVSALTTTAGESAPASRPTKSSPHAFPAALRLRKPAQFRQVLGGKRLGNGLFTATVVANELGFARLGLTTPKRVLARAVDRNRVRRQVREIFRLCASDLPALDIVIGLRPGISGASAAQMRENLTSLWQRIIAQCASSSKS